MAADEDGPPAPGVLVVRASGAAAALAALVPGAAGGDTAARAGDVQLVMRATVPRGVPGDARRLDVPGCAVELRAPADSGRRAGVVVLTVAARRLSIDLAELQPLMFQQVPVDRPLEALFTSAVAHLLGATNTTATNTAAIDRHGAAHYLTGLVELVLRSALSTRLHRVDAAAARHREAVEYVNRHLADPDLSAERIAEALFVSRRRLYQLFDDGEGISGRIRRMRVDRAKELLADPTRASYGIGEVAKMCGFVNAAHFSRTFRRIVGSTPREYRDSITKVH